MAALDPLKKAAIYAMSLADEGGDVAKVADDWGWKGGKPGEVTAGSLRYDYGDLGKLGRQILESESPLGKAAREMQTKGTGVEDPWQVGAHYKNTLALLEEADVPREWTGKITAVANDLIEGSGGGAQRAQMLLQNPRDFFANKQLPTRLSRAMREMTNDQRETFLALLPEWSGSLDELAETARSL
jgi:hypothetical protein